MAVKTDNWFAVSRVGLAQLMDGREKSFIVRELVQNAWDEPGVSYCRVTLEPSDTRGYVWVSVVDNAPEGFSDITHAYTLFANTRKRKDPDKRGRFNLGEKQVLSLCKEAEIKTTTCTIRFNQDGTRTTSKDHTTSGSVFRGLVRMNRDEMQQCIDALKTFIRPACIRTWVNDYDLPQRLPLATRTAKLTTEYADEEGAWRRSKRNTEIEVYKVPPEEVPTLYEMGIPVVELEAGDCFHYNVNQRVPLNQDRDNVSPAYLRDLRAEVMNAVAEHLTEEDAAEPWAREATDSDRIERDAFEVVLEKRYGDKVVSRSVDDEEANNAAVAKGYTILSGGSMTRGEWDNAKRFDSIRSSHHVAPTRHPQFSADGMDTTVPLDKWTQGMKNVVTFIQRIVPRLMDGSIEVRIVRDKWNRFGGWYGGYTLTMNLQVLGHKFFNEFPGNMERVVDFVVHELGHHFESNHLSDNYHKALTKMAGQLVALAIVQPSIFKVR
jgi:hypothetical protein